MQQLSLVCNKDAHARSHLVDPVEELKDADETGSGEEAQGPAWKCASGSQRVQAKFKCQSRNTPSMVYNGHSVTDTYSPSDRLYKRGCVNHIRELH